MLMLQMDDAPLDPQPNKWGEVARLMVPIEATEHAVHTQGGGAKDILGYVLHLM